VIRIAGALYDVNAVFIISCSTLLRMRTVRQFADKIKKKYINTV
jgi:hypothetical protein